MALRLSPPRLLPLTIVIMLLLLSIKAVTFAKDAGAALGLVSSNAPAVPLIARPGASGSKPSPNPVEKSPVIEVSKAERALLQDLRKRREQLDAREHSLEERNSVLEATEGHLQAKIDHLTELETNLGQLDKARRQRQDENWSGLVKIYESMKPRDAATIFDVLDMHVVLEVLDRMNERKAAAVLAGMQPERARLATQMLAQKRLRQDVLVSQATSDIQGPIKPAQ